MKEHEAEASAIEIYLAAEVNDITKLADAQVETLNCPLNISSYSPWNIDIQLEGQLFQHSRRRLRQREHERT